MTTHLPETEAAAAAVVAEAFAAKTPLALQGGGTKIDFGRPAQTQDTLSAAKLAGITLYEPAELVIGARAGTPLAAVKEKLRGKNQGLAFEPMDFRTLMGTSGEPTIGAVAACNISGPRRISAGAARDSLLGVRLVNGKAEIVKSGGRVMKNVTGLDLVKLNAGAYGTLGFLTEVIFKVLPMPERGATLVLEGLADDHAVAALSAALGSPYEVTGAAHLPVGLDDGQPARTLVRVEGFTDSVDHRLQRLTEALGAAKITLLDGEESAHLWKRVRDAAFVAEPRGNAVWRISAAPSNGPKVVAAAELGPARHFYDWGGGLVWLSVPASGDAGAAGIRKAVAAHGGHATLVRAPAELRAAVEVFQPLAGPLMRLTAGIKASFDPAGILNPGRMYAGI